MIAELQKSGALMVRIEREPEPPPMDASPFRRVYAPGLTVTQPQLVLPDYQKLNVTKLRDTIRQHYGVEPSGRMPNGRSFQKPKAEFGGDVHRSSYRCDGSDEW